MKRWRIPRGEPVEISRAAGVVHKVYGTHAKPVPCRFLSHKTQPFSRLMKRGGGPCREIVPAGGIWMCHCRDAITLLSRGGGLRVSLVLTDAVDLVVDLQPGTLLVRAQASHDLHHVAHHPPANPPDQRRAF